MHVSMAPIIPPLCNPASIPAISVIALLIPSFAFSPNSSYGLLGGHLPLRTLNPCRPSSPHRRTRKLRRRNARLHRILRQRRLPMQPQRASSLLSRVPRTQSS